MILVVDVENTTTKRAYKESMLDMSPHHPNNKLVSVGWTQVKNGEVGHAEYAILYHNHDPEPHQEQYFYRSKERVQEALDGASVLVGHNIKHDLKWLLESGFTIPDDVDVWDTQICEFVMARGRRDIKVSLEDSCRRRDVQLKKSDLIDEYYKKGITFDDIPIDTVVEYGKGDCISTGSLFLVQKHLLKDDRNKSLVKSIEMMNKMLLVVVDIERNGIAVNTEELNKIDKEFEKEQKEIDEFFSKAIPYYMGDTPINLASGGDRSKLIYSREVNDKKAWKEKFNLGLDDRGKRKYRPRMNDQVFSYTVSKMTTIVDKTESEHCFECKGTGKYEKFKVDGTPHKNKYKCKKCDGTGVVYKPTGKVAGLRMGPSGVMDVAVEGFVTDKAKLEYLSALCRNKGHARKEQVINNMIRHSALQTYRGTFIQGIRNALRDTGLLHFQLNQTIASTARLSSSDPNFHNQPRGSTFPLRRAIVSRWKEIGGKICKADYAQLEFRAAGILSGCESIADAIKRGVDVHTDTATILTEAGQPTSRQEAKADTFKPLYGGQKGTPAQEVYYKKFIREMYPGVGEWHEKLQEEAIKYKVITIPTGRQYAFPGVKRTNYGVTQATQIKNWPVQGFATGDIVPMACILFREDLNNSKLKSLFINTVHDEIVVDVYPGEEEEVCSMLMESMLGVVKAMYDFYGVEIHIPLGVEVSIGPSWGECETVASEERSLDYYL